MQIKKFTIDDVSLCQIEDAVIKCIQQEQSWHYTPEVCLHRWMASPRLFSKLCFKLIFSMPERALSLAKYLVGKKELFYILGELPFEINTEKSFEIQIEFSEMLAPQISFSNREKMLELVLLTIKRLPMKSLEEIFPYILSPVWTRKEVNKILEALVPEIEKELSLHNYIVYMVAKELSGFNRLRFESNLKYFAKKFYKKEFEKIDIEKQFFPILLKIMFWVNPDSIEEVWASYWDQQDFIAFVLINTVDDVKKQMMWAEKILSKEDRLDAYEMIAASIAEQNFPVIEGFSQECIQAIEDYGGFELVYLRVPNIFITLLELDFALAISLINSIFDEEILTSSVEFALEYLCTAKNFSPAMCKRIVVWLKNPSITKCIGANDLLYFYCQLVERMFDIDCEREAKKIVSEIIRLTKICQEREKRYYLEDLIIHLLDKDLDLAYKIVQSYSDNEDLYVKVMVKKMLLDFDRTLESVKNNEDFEIAHAIIEGVAEALIEHQPQRLFVLEKSVNELLCGDTLWGALAIACTNLQKCPQQYLQKIDNYNVLLKTYCEIIEVYINQNNSEMYINYKNKIEKLVKGIKPSYNFLGLSLEWDSGFPVEIPTKTLVKLSYLHPKSTIELFFMYLEHDRFIDFEDTLQAIFRAIALKCPEEVTRILKRVDQFDLTDYRDVLQEQAKQNPKRVMSWLVQVDQTHLFPIVLDEIRDEQKFALCLELALEYNNHFSKQDYINRLTILIKYLFRLGGQSVIFSIMEDLQIFSPPPATVVIDEVIKECIRISCDWEERQKQKLTEE